MSVDTVTRIATDSQVVEPLLPVTGADLQVPLATGGQVRFANFDYAASAPALGQVVSRLEEATPFYASVHRGSGWASQVSTAMYETSRQRVGRALGIAEDQVVIFTRNTTDSLNLLASAIPAQAGSVVVLDLEHHANLLPWQRGNHRVVATGATLEITIARIEQELSDGNVALLSVTGASNVTGEELPIRRLTELAHRYGARISIDAAQLAPHRAVDLTELGVDFLALSGHKLYAPYGAGVLVGRRDWLDQARPYLAGGGAVRHVAVDDVDWAPSPARHEAGSPNVLGAVALAAALDTLTALAPGALEGHEAVLRERLVAGLEQHDEVSIVRIWKDGPSCIGVVTFQVEGYDPGLLAAILSAEHGIGVRDGKFCAHPLLNRLGVSDGAVRASLGVGSCSADIDRLVGAIGQILRDGPQLQYTLVQGRFAPVGDVRRLPDWLVDQDAVGSFGASPCQEA